MEQISAFAIDTPANKDFPTDILAEFKNHPEFDVHVNSLDATDDNRDNRMGSLIAAIQRAKDEDLDAVLICGNEHRFTFSYHAESFFKDLHTAADYGCQLLFGGVGYFQNLIPVEGNLAWVDRIEGVHFFVVFSNAYDVVLNAINEEGLRNLDDVLTRRVSNKMLVYPFVSDCRNQEQHNRYLQAIFKVKRYVEIFREYGVHSDFGTLLECRYPFCDYLASEPAEAKLHIGCGPYVKRGWLNVDINPTFGVEFMDASREFPFAAERFRYVYSEHLLEHLDYWGGRNFLAESYRVLQKGGTMRLALPNLDFLIELYKNPHTAVHRKYIEWSVGQYSPETSRDFNFEEVPASYVLNHYLRAWGHQLVYDKKLLVRMLKMTGFTQIHFCEVGQSDIPALNGMEEHGHMIPSWANQLETMVVEATK